VRVKQDNGQYHYVAYILLTETVNRMIVQSTVLGSDRLSLSLTQPPSLTLPDLNL